MVMARANYTAQQFIDAIPGSGGIISTIARRVGCSWHTAKKYIENYVTVKRAYDDEVGTVGDMVDSIIIRNLQLISEEQKASKKPVDITDAKWYATVKLANRGYSPKQQVDVTSKGEQIKVTIGSMNLNDDV